MFTSNNDEQPFPEHPRLQSAMGYFDLFEDAWEELESVDPTGDTVLEVEKLRLLFLLREERWEAGLEQSRKLYGLNPEHLEGLIHAAYCLHELGRTKEAQGVLEEAPESLREESVYYYNLGCYKAVLGQVDDARQLIEKSFEMDTDLRDIARADPDLEVLWDML